MIRKRPKSHNDELKYALPPISAKKAAAIAIKRIEAARILDVGYLVYLLQHSNILVLAGLRASSLGVSFSADISGRRLTRFELYLKSIGTILLPEGIAQPGKPATSFTLLSPKGVERLQDIYGFIPKSRPLWTRPLLPTEQGFVMWSYEVERNLAVMMEDGTLPRGWLFDWWAPHNLRMGMLLGYPGVAISSYLWLESQFKNTGHSPEPIYFTMNETDELLGSEVGFQVAKQAVHAPEIAALYDLWNSVIKEVIDHFASYDLEHNKMFLREFKAYRKKF